MAFVFVLLIDSTRVVLRDALPAAVSITLPPRPAFFGAGEGAGAGLRSVPASAFRLSVFAAGVRPDAGALGCATGALRAADFFTGGRAFETTFLAGAGFFATAGLTTFFAVFFVAAGRLGDFTGAFAAAFFATGFRAAGFPDARAGAAFFAAGFAAFRAG